MTKKEIEIASETVRRQNQAGSQIVTVHTEPSHVQLRFSLVVRRCFSPSPCPTLR